MKLNLRRGLSIAGSALVTSLVFAAPAFAETQVKTTLLGSNNIISTIFNIVSLVAVVLFIILLLIGGIQYLGSFGNEEATTKARKLILDAVVGLFIVLAAGGIAKIVLNELNLGGVNLPGGAGNVLN